MSRELIDFSDQIDEHFDPIEVNAETEALWQLISNWMNSAKVTTTSHKETQDHSADDAWWI